MNKTIRQNFTSRIQHSHERLHSSEANLLPGFQTEMKMLRQDAADLLSPRPQAVNRLLQLSRELGQA